MSKELINEIESKIAWNDMNIDETSISLSDVKRLLNELEEQAERAEELERKTERYREATRECIERMNEGGAGTRSFVYEKLIEVLERNNDA